MGIYIAGQEYGKAYLAGAEVSQILARGEEYHSAATPASFWDSAVVDGWTDPNEANATPGAVLAISQRAANAQSSSIEELVSSRVAANRVTQRIPPSYIQDSVTAYLTLLGFESSDVITFRTGTSASDTQAGRGGGPQLTDAAESNWGIAVRIVGGNTYKWRVRDLVVLDTSEPYLWRADDASDVHRDLARTGAQAQAIIVDIGNANVDWDNLMFRDVSGAAPGPGPAPDRPTHTFSILAGGSGSVGYNAPGGFGSIATGSTATYDTPGGKSVTVVHARNVSNEVNFALQGAAQVAADFPTRIVATRGTNSVTLTVQAGSLRPISNGRFIRQDYDPMTGTISSVFVTGQTIRFDLYY